MYDAESLKAHEIALQGEYDLSRKQELADRFGAIKDGGIISIDMQDVTYVDSTFLNELTAFRLRLGDRPMMLIGVRPNIVRILSVAKLDRFFTFQPV